MGLCTVAWRGEKYRIECSPSSLLSIATKIAEIEHIPYLEVYRGLVNSLEDMYRNTKRKIDMLLSEKQI
ncbi:conserved hypothetical protein [Pyrobaculum islandicum DSM 4184]|uniref:Uncharacterized protein n=1 Tax=Pyrobaculum islandicum (strain DSM 4184 / JCM 9189 / GEO3) TaxID=384616 RepID=A1RSA0_PYRIL|nr:hypothetical protein [Pyrobaculum islandicum]ABL87832.1 conserved hypothetical protein [Pyrobaculum islandicum DSM 4184]